MTRKKPLNDLQYITIPLKSLPVDIEKEDDVISDILDTINHLYTEKIVNLSSYTNTDLKLKYGAPNLPILTRYDHAYLMLVRTLQKWAERLFVLGYEDQAQSVLEYAVHIDSDAVTTYRFLASIYVKKGENHRISALRDRVQLMESSSQKNIIKALDEAMKPDFIPVFPEKNQDDQLPQYEDSVQFPDDAWFHENILRNDSDDVIAEESLPDYSNGPRDYVDMSDIDDLFS